MERFINQQVNSRLYGSGIVKEVDNNNLRITIQFENQLKLLGFKTSIENKIFVFTDDDVQKDAEVYINPIKLHIKITAEEDIKSTPDEFFEIKRDFGFITELKLHTSYGTNAQEIYKKCCDSFCWEYSLNGKFSKLKILFAENVFKNYSCWMLPYSNGTVMKTEKWTNVVKGKFIWEKYDIGILPMTFADKRITFVRIKNPETNKYEYVFMGIYQSFTQFISEDNDKLVLKYKRIADNYPEL